MRRKSLLLSNLPRNGGAPPEVLKNVAFKERDIPYRIGLETDSGSTGRKRIERMAPSRMLHFARPVISGRFVFGLVLGILILCMPGRLSAGSKAINVFEPIAELKPGEAALYVYIPLGSPGHFEVHVNKKSIGDIRGGTYLSTVISGHVRIDSLVLTTGITNAFLVGALGDDKRFDFDALPGQSYYARGDVTVKPEAAVVVFKTVDAATGLEEIRSLIEGHGKKKK